MKKLLILFSILFSSLALGQTVPATLTLNWTAPTVTDTGLPLTGSLAITQYQLVISTSAIDPNFAGTPTVVVTAPTLTSVQAMNVANGDTLHVRIRACNKPAAALDCSKWTSEGTKLVQVSTTPEVPTNIVIDLKIGP